MPNGSIYSVRGRETQDDALFQQAFEKYHQAVTIKPDLHEAWNGIGILHAYRREFQMAAQNFEKALGVARESKDIRNLRNYADNLIHALQDVTLDHIDQRNVGEANVHFRRALESKSELDSKVWWHRLVEFFGNFVSKQHAGLFFDFYDILKEKTLEEEVRLLSPFAIACEYWEKNEDAEVLDRLNPEWREVVEDIIKKSEERR